MKKFKLVLALLAALSTVLVPVAPASADNGGSSSRTSAIARQAEQGNAAIISKAQMNRLATSRPRLHAKLMQAYHTNSIPKLTAAEKRYVDGITKKNLKTYKAGDPLLLAGAGATAFGTGGWLVVAFIVFVLILILYQHLFSRRLV